MSHSPIARRTVTSHTVTPASLIDEVMSVLARGEAALFADLAQAAWQPQATLGSLTGSANRAFGGTEREPS